MKRKMFETAMTMMDAHSAALQCLGFSKWFVRDHSPVHRVLVYIAFKLTMSMRNPV